MYVNVSNNRVEEPGDMYSYALYLEQNSLNCQGIFSSHCCLDESVNSRPFHNAILNCKNKFKADMKVNSLSCLELVQVSSKDQR